MDTVFKKFYRNLYHKTNGFILTKPLNQHMYPGDFFQIKNGEMIILGNIFRNNVVNADDLVFENMMKLNAASWNFSDGVSKSYSGREKGHNAIEGDFEFSKQILAFEKFGSFIFKGANPEVLKFANWNDFEAELIIKMTQVLYSFRELYLVTEIATTEHWTLAIAGSDKAELEIATETENFGLVDIFGNASTKTVQAKGIEFYHREDRKRPSFFKAKKLVVQQEKLEVFTNQLINDQMKIPSWATNFYPLDFHFDTASHSTPMTTNAQASVLDMLPANELNPKTALDYFKWTNTNLDDIEKLFTTYGN